MKISPPLSICSVNGSLFWLVQKFSRMRLIDHSVRKTTFPAWTFAFHIGSKLGGGRDSWLVSTLAFHHISEDCFHALLVSLLRLLVGFV